MVEKLNIAFVRSCDIIKKKKRGGFMKILGIVLLLAVCGVCGAFLEDLRQKDIAKKVADEMKKQQKEDK